MKKHPLAVAQNPPTKYRLLEVGKFYKYQAKLGKGLDSRRGQSCVVMIVPRSGQVGNVRVQFLDGTIHVVPAGVLKPVNP
jgi:hypothetical protein